MNEPKQVKVGERVFQLRRMTPQSGARIRNLLLVASMKFQQTQAQESSSEANSEFSQMSGDEKAKQVTFALWTAAASSLSASEYTDIQNQCLKLCDSAIGESFAPVMMTDGRFADKEVESSPAVVDQLVLESLAFNLHSFFSDGPLQTPVAG